MRLDTRGASVVNNRDIPDICLQQMVAVMLLDKTVSFAGSHDEARMHDPAVLHERAKVELLPDKELDRGVREAIVEVTLRGRHDAARARPRRARHRGQSDAARRGGRQVPRPDRAGAGGSDRRGADRQAC